MDESINGLKDEIKRLTVRCANLEKQILESDLSKARYRSIADNSSDGICRLNRNFQILFANRRLAQTLNMTMDQYLGRTPRELGLSGAFCNFVEQQVLKAFQSREIQICQKQAFYRETNMHLDWRFIPEFDDYGQVGTVLIVTRDITEQSMTDAELKELSDLFTKAFESNPSPMAICENLSGNYIRVNRSLEEMVGINQDDLAGHNPLELGHMDAKTKALITHHISRHGFLRNLEISYSIAGKTLYGLLSSEPIQVNNQRCNLFVFSDITDQKQNQEQLARLATITAQAEESIMITDINGSILDVNQTFESLSGFNRVEVLGQNAMRLFRMHNARQIKSAIREGQIWRAQASRKRKDGRTYEVESKILPIKDERGAIINLAIVDHDMTKELELEKKLIQAQKMEAIGTLAGGIAHDFNNILSPIIGYAEISQTQLNADHAIQRNLSQILKAANRAKEMVKHILTFSRQTEQEMKPLQLQPIIKESLKLLRASLPSTITFEQQIDAGCGPVMADPTQIHQVVMNLCTNAYHAMPQGGTLFIGLSSLELSQPDEELELKPGNYICFKVSDTGHGMSAEIMERIFDPYYTTKVSGKGTGLGLSVVHGIISRSHGQIRVKSELDQGTTFSIYLPVLDVEDNDHEEQAAHAAPHGSGTILLVDDDEMLLIMMQELLEHLGYQVVAHLSSVEALEHFREMPDDFDLLISDMTMPHMTGEELIQNIKEIRHEIPIILSTGYSDVLSDERIRNLDIQAVAMKPVVMDELAQTITNLLGQHD